MPPKINAFMIFAKEWRLENDPFMSIQDAIQEAGKVWEKMSTEERKPYHDKCTELRIQQQQAKKMNK